VAPRGCPRRRVPESQITISPGNGVKIKRLSLLEQRARSLARARARAHAEGAEKTATGETKRRIVYK